MAATIKQRSSASGYVSLWRRYRSLPASLWRFAIIGLLNTAIDIVLLNLLIALFHLNATGPILLANCIAYAIGAVNSYVLNKYWTFAGVQRHPITAAELYRFAITTLSGSAVNTLLFWVFGRLIGASLTSGSLWTTIAKLGAIGGSMLISYTGMRLWVFNHRKEDHHS